MEEITELRRISIDLKKIIETEGKEKDILLCDGDVIDIPKETLTVMVSGAVINPKSIIYEPKKDIEYYITRCGGYADDANRKKAVVIRANGEILPGGKVSSINKGDIILIPPKFVVVREKKTGWEKMKDMVRVIADTATAVYIIKSIGEISK